MKNKMITHSYTQSIQWSDFQDRRGLAYSKVPNLQGTLKMIKMSMNFMQLSCLAYSKTIIYHAN